MASEYLYELCICRSAAGTYVSNASVVEDRCKICAVYKDYLVCAVEVKVDEIVSSGTRTPCVYLCPRSGCATLEYLFTTCSNDLIFIDVYAKNLFSGRASLRYDV